jgi:hypothetical protein
MRWHTLTAAALVLTGCGSRISGTSAPESANILWTRGANGPVVMIGVGFGTCSSPAKPADGFLFLFGGSDVAKLEPGATFPLVSDINAPATGEHVTGSTEAPLTGGTITFTTFALGASATGSYDVLFAGGEASGGFSGDFCPYLACVP